jgi:hypothetical protein
MSPSAFSADDEPAAPAVFGPEHVGEDDDEPTLAYVPSERVLKDDQEVRLEFRRTEDGRVAIPCYQSLEALVGACGDLQPWVSIPSDKLPEIQQRSGVDLVVWDAALPSEARKDSKSAAGGARKLGGGR